MINYSTFSEWFDAIKARYKNYLDFEVKIPLRALEKLDNDIDTINTTLTAKAEITPTKVNITQATNKTTGVTASGVSGVITTVALTDAAGADFSFTVTNTLVTTTSVIQLTPVYAVAQTGYPVVRVSAVANGSFVVAVANVHASEALNAALAINYTIQ